MLAALAEYDLDRILERATVATHDDIAEAWQPFASRLSSRRFGCAAHMARRTTVAEPIIDPVPGGHHVARHWPPKLPRAPAAPRRS